MTDVTRSQLAKAFTVAQRYLAGCGQAHMTTVTRSLFICDALRLAYNYSHISHHTCRDATDVIEARLGRYSSVGTWMEAKIGPDPVRSDLLDNDGRKLQAARLAWLKSLAKEYSN